MNLKYKLAHNIANVLMSLLYSKSRLLTELPNLLLFANFVIRHQLKSSPYSSHTREFAQKKEFFKSNCFDTNCYILSES